VAAALAALRIMRAEPERIARVNDNGDLLRRVLTEAGAAPLPGCGAIVAVPTGPEDVTAAAWRAAFDDGVFVNAVAHPAVPRGEGILRLAVMATHTPEQVRRAGEVVAAAVRSAGLADGPA
jgi:8-amino-7-oxononanoate synthase